MANLAPKRPRGGVLVKEEELSQIEEESSPRRAHGGWEATPRRQPDLESCLALPTPRTPSLHSYRLDYLNSITIDDGKLCNLLTIHAEKYRNGRKIKCRCSKSKCGSRYCQCFSRGVVCGVDCECVNCCNTVSVGEPKEEQHRGCRCSKSHCLKNYCECFQRGQLCGQKCNCTNCKNTHL